MYNVQYYRPHLQSSSVERRQLKSTNKRCNIYELLSRKERKWIWDLCSITPYGLNQDDGYYCQNKRCRKR